MNIDVSTPKLAKDELLCDNCIVGCEKCNFTRILKKRLYAVAFEIRNSKGHIKPGIQHVHAVDSQHAKSIFANACKGLPPRSVHIVGAAPVLGYFGKEVYDREADQKKIVLSV